MSAHKHNMANRFHSLLVRSVATSRPAGISVGVARTALTPTRSFLYGNPAVASSRVLESLVACSRFVWLTVKGAMQSANLQDALRSLHLVELDQHERLLAAYVQLFSCSKADEREMPREDQRTSSQTAELRPSSRHRRHAAARDDARSSRGRPLCCLHARSTVVKRGTDLISFSRFFLIPVAYPDQEGELL